VHRGPRTGRTAHTVLCIEDNPANLLLVERCWRAAATCAC
jgi:hypothetical protein